MKALLVVCLLVASGVSVASVDVGVFGGSVVSAGNSTVLPPPPPGPRPPLRCPPPPARGSGCP
jgi:hypothetical protein